MMSRDDVNNDVLMFTLMYFVMFTMLRVFVLLLKCHKFVLRSVYVVRKSKDYHKIDFRFFENFALASTL